MSEAILITLAGAPMGKQTRSTHGGVSFTPKPTRNYMAALRILAQEAMRGRAPIEGPVRLSIMAYLPIPASWSKRKRAAALAGETHPNVKPDWDNIGKMCDAFKEVVWRDDKQVYSAGVVKMYSSEPRVCISVMPA